MPFWLLFEFWQGWLGMSCMRKNLNRKRRIPIETNRQMCFSENGRPQNTRVYTGILSSSSHSTATFPGPHFQTKYVLQVPVEDPGSYKAAIHQGYHMLWMVAKSPVDQWETSHWWAFKLFQPSKFGGFSDFATIQSGMTFISPRVNWSPSLRSPSFGDAHGPSGIGLREHSCCFCRDRWLGFTRLETLRVHICRTSSLVHRAYKPTNITGGGTPSRFPWICLKILVKLMVNHVFFFRKLPQTHPHTTRRGVSLVVVTSRSPSIGGWMIFGEELQGIDSLEVSVDLQMAYCFQIFRASHHPSFAERFWTTRLKTNGGLIFQMPNSAWVSPPEIHGVFWIL